MWFMMIYPEKNDHHLANNCNVIYCKPGTYKLNMKYRQKIWKTTEYMNALLNKSTLIAMW